MTELNTSQRHRWSWRSCFANVKKTKKQQNRQSDLTKLPPNNHITNKRLQNVDENSNLLGNSSLCDFDLLSETRSSNDYHPHLISNTCITKIESLINENNFIDSDHIQQILEDSTLNQKSSSTIRATQLDAIVEDLNEENSDELDETVQPTRLCCDREIIDDSNDLYSRLFDLSKMNHVIIQFNENGYLLDEFKRQIGKLKMKTDDILRISSQLPRDAELLEARYSTLLASIESLSLLLKIAQISSSRSLTNRLIFSIEQRMEQLNQLVQLSGLSSINVRQQRQDLNDDDFLSFRSALSSYEHLLTIS